MLSSFLSSRGLVINIVLGLCLTALFLALLLFSNLTGTEIFFSIFLLIMFAWNIDARASIACALCFIVSIPILLILKEISIFGNVEKWTEQIAIWTFYFLTIGIIKQIWEIHRGKNINQTFKPKEISTPSYIFKPTIKEAAPETVTKPKLIHDIKPPLPKKKI